MILKWAILHNEYFNLWYFKYILMLIVLCFYLGQILNALLFVREYTLLQVKVMHLKSDSKNDHKGILRFST